MKKIALFTLLLLVFSCHPGKMGKVGKQQRDAVITDDSIKFIPPKNIILMIGDGMGITQITAGMYLNGNKLNLEQFQYIGLHKTYAANNLVTDSGAGATAFSIGKKTYNGGIGRRGGGEKRLAPMLHQLVFMPTKKAGKWWKKLRRTC
jgi:alkaline phosphatase